MITASQLRMLEEFECRDGRVLSVYLNLGPDRQLERAFRIAFEDLVKAQHSDATDEATRAQFDREIQRVRAWLENRQPRGLGFAAFSSEICGLWLAQFLPVGVADDLVFEERPRLSPLLDVVDEYERFGVVLVDHDRARFFTVYLGEIEEHRTFAVPEPRRHEVGAPQRRRDQEHHDAHVHRQLKALAERLSAENRARPFDRLIIGGPEEMATELRRMLPRPLAERVAAVTPATTDAALEQILNDVLEVERGLERRDEERIVGELLEWAPAGGATCGIDRTLDALWVGAASTLVVAEGMRREGAESPSCGRLLAGRPSECPACGDRPRPVTDLVERAVERMLDGSGRVEFVHGEPATLLRERCGGIGALLRFRLPVTLDTIVSGAGAGGGSRSGRG